jgi:hypothetical protein
MRARDCDLPEGGTLHLRGKISVYPQSSDANKPRSLGELAAQKLGTSALCSKWAARTALSAVRKHRR